MFRQKFLLALCLTAVLLLPQHRTASAHTGCDTADAGTDESPAERVKTVHGTKRGETIRHVSDTEHYWAYSVRAYMEYRDMLALEPGTDKDGRQLNENFAQQAMWATTDAGLRGPRGQRWIETGVTETNFTGSRPTHLGVF